VGWDERGSQLPKRAQHRRFVEALCGIEPEVAQASSLAREFLGLIHRRDVDGSDGWLVRARVSKASELRRFAGRIGADLSAVRGAFESPSSSGQVEGQINRLKFLKCQMYDRAKLDKIWLVSFLHYDLGFFDHQTGTVTSAENPFGAKVTDVPGTDHPRHADFQSRPEIDPSYWLSWYVSARTLEYSVQSHTDKYLIYANTA
jgi:hypothetical protein